MFGFSILKFDTSLQKASVLNYKLLQKKISKSCYFFSADEQKSTRGSIHSKGMKYSSEFHFILELAPKENPNFLWYGDSPCWSYFPSLFSFISSYFHSRKKLQKKKWKWKKTRGFRSENQIPPPISFSFPFFSLRKMLWGKGRKKKTASKSSFESIRTRFLNFLQEITTEVSCKMISPFSCKCLYIKPKSFHHFVEKLCYRKMAFNAYLHSKAFRVSRGLENVYLVSVVISKRQYWNNR